jgi:hypothetical protein
MIDAAMCLKSDTLLPSTLLKIPVVGEPRDLPPIKKKIRRKNHKKKASSRKGLSKEIQQRRIRNI